MVDGLVLKKQPGILFETDGCRRAISAKSNGFAKKEMFETEETQVLCLCQGLRLANSRWQVVFPLCRKVAKERPVCCRFDAKDSCHSCDMLQAVCISFCSSTFNPIFQDVEDQP